MASEPARDIQGSDAAEGRSGLSEVLRRSLTVGGKPFECVYLETSFLIGADWPRASQPLLSVTSVCALIGIPVYLPEPVAVECEAHWMRDWDATSSKEVAVRRQLIERLKTIEFPRALAVTLPTRADVLDRYHAQAARTIEICQIKVSPWTPRQLKDVFCMAVHYIPPFQRGQDRKGKEGKGFQDAVNWASVIDHARASGLNRAALLASDSDFTDAAEWSRKNEGVDVIILESSDAFTKTLMQRVAEGTRAQYEEQKQKAAAALEAHRALIDSAIREKIDVSLLYVGFIKPTSVTRIDFRNVVPDHVQPPLSPPASGEWVTIGFRIPASAHVVIDRFDSPPEPPLRLGETRPSSGLFGLPPISFPEFRREEADVDTTLVGEVQAQYRDGKYVDLEITHIRLG